MKKFASTISAVALLIIVGGLVFVPHVAFAEGYFEGIALKGILNMLSGISYYVLTLTGSFVTIAGMFLSVSINLTTHIKDIYTATTGIQSVWIVVRDLASMFVIFSLLYYSILTIIGKADGKVKELIVKIFLAGIFINFSLFFVRVAVDGSNLVSLQFYNAIAPNTSQNWTVGEAFQDGGLSNVFVQSLKIPKIYGNANVLKATDIGGGILIATVGGIIVMVTAGLSFLAAAIAFTARTGIILFVMALSPLYFAGMIFPALEEKVSKPLMKLFKGQLIFMPVYLFLMYVALKIISDPSFMKIFNPTIGATDPNGFGPVWIGTMIQYTIAIIFINAPLLAAISLGGVGMKWAPTARDVSGRISGFFGRNTAGRFLKGAGESFDSRAAQFQNSELGKSVVGQAAVGFLRGTRISQATRGALEKGEKAKYGGTYNLADVKKENKERAKEVAKVGRTDVQNAAIKAYLTTEFDSHAPTPLEITEFRDKVVSKIDAKELQDMEFEKLKDPRVASGIPSNKFDTLIKELTPAQQDELKAARKQGFTKILDDHGADFLLGQALKGKPQDIAKLPDDILTDVRVSSSLDGATLRKLIDENMEGGKRDTIRRAILARYAAAPAGAVPAPLQKAHDYLTSPAGQIF